MVGCQPRHTPTRSHRKATTMSTSGSDLAQPTRPDLRIQMIDPARDAETVLAWTREAFVVSFGEAETQHLFHRVEMAAMPEEAAVGMLLMNLRRSEEAGSLDLDEVIGYVHLLYVASAYRGHGVADALQQHAEDVCRHQGARHLELNVEPANERAVRFYRRVGYEVARETLREGLPVLRMRKPIGTSPLMASPD
jgi:ribosomal protein S18 acetylase RimI-like enzyme